MRRLQDSFLPALLDKDNVNQLWVVKNLLLEEGPCWLKEGHRVWLGEKTLSEEVGFGEVALVGLGRLKEKKSHSKKKGKLTQVREKVMTHF